MFDNLNVLYLSGRAPLNVLYLSGRVPLNVLYLPGRVPLNVLFGAGRVRGGRVIRRREGLQAPRPLLHVRNTRPVGPCSSPMRRDLW